MLIILPPSETKRQPAEDGPSLDLDSLSFPELGPMRRRILDALIATSQAPDALRRLQVGPSLAGEVARNAHLHALPTMRAVEAYAGPLYAGLEPATWSAEARARASRQVVIASALWGALRVDDCIPPYRLHACARLVGLDRLEPLWRTLLPAVLRDAAGDRGPILDLRSPAYQAVGRPTGLDAETVTLRIRPAPGGPPHIGDVIAKRVRGEAARQLLFSTAEPEEPLDVADVLAERWPIEIEAPAGRTRFWTIALEAAPRLPPRETTANAPGRRPPRPVPLLGRG
ncbi:MAG TPA: peroxide stress protein YaaA [Candidatus Limnocylindria bacterium]|nr:peroxide stress protein YaaA [Candidatus Limnocylindria bacterium]